MNLLVILFLQAWHALSLQQCIAYTSGAPDHPSVVFFGGACTDAIQYANAIGGWWAHIQTPTLHG